MDKIFFTTNWNKKLYTDYFSSIRKSRPAYYIEGRDYEVWLKDSHLFNAELYKVHTLSFGNIHPITIMIDTGYSYDQSCKIFMNFLHCSTIEQLKAEIVDHLLFHKIVKNGNH